MSEEYSEDKLVQESAATLLHDELGWDTVYAYDTEIMGEDGTLGRKENTEVLLFRYFRRALKKFNPWMTAPMIDEAEKTLLSRISTDSLLQTNEKKYRLIRDGIPVTVKKPDGSTEEKRALVIDFKNPEENHFLAVRELYIKGKAHLRRPDIIGFVNGIPLLFMELKNYTVSTQDAYTLNYTDYLDTIPHLFDCNAFVMLSNGKTAKVGTLGSPYVFFHEWKRLREEDAGNIELPTMLRGICKKENFLDLFENFILYDHSGGETAKILARNHQYLGVNEAVEAYRLRALKNGKLGVFWHTQGSGKSYSMLFLTQKIRRKFPGSPTFVMLTDRDELNRQLSDTFSACGLLGASPASSFIASSGRDLVQKLSGNPGFIFTLIQKFNQENPTPITPDHDIIIISDEAHRSQYGKYAENMMHLLPTASRLGFTGTPLLAFDEITKRTFGDYISVYDFRRAVEDGATVPLYYDNRAVKIKDLKNPKISEEMAAAIEAAELDPAEEEKVIRHFKKEIHLLTAEPRLRAIAKDFAAHYSDLWTSGKAMFVCLNKVTCVRMYNFVQEYWQKEISRIENDIRHATDQQEAQDLKRKVAWMKETEMAVVISQEQNEIQLFRKWGLDIMPHRMKMENRDLEREFKDKNNPFRVVFVCAMWLTGFDVKCLSCLYLDKPLQAHTLMQTIARANRVAEGKNNGLILDYIGIVKELEKALADYTRNSDKDGKDGNGGANPLIDKEKLKARLLLLIRTAEDFLTKRHFALQDLIDAKGFEKLSLLRDAANLLYQNLETKKEFSAYANEIKKITKYMDRDDLDPDTKRQKDAIIAISDALQKERKHVDTTDLEVEIQDIIKEYVETEIPVEEPGARQFDISQINFELLQREFSAARHKNLFFRDIKEIVEKQLQLLLENNPARIDFYERYQDIIEEYNKTQDRAAIEKIFHDLMDFAGTLCEEEKRYIREGFQSDEELSLYDLLFKENLSKKDIQAIKKVASDLLSTIKTKIAEMDHWADKPETQAAINTTIKNMLYAEMPACYESEALNGYQQKIYEYIYNRYGMSA